MLGRLFKTLSLGFILCQICAGILFPTFTFAEVSEPRANTPASSPNEQSVQKIGRVHRIMACESLLWTIAKNPTDSPRDALNDVRTKLLDRLHPDVEEYDTNPELGAKSSMARVSFEAKDNKLNRKAWNTILARTDLILDETEEVNFDINFVGRVYRGEKQIQQALGMFTSELENSQHQLKKRLDEMYPAIRYATLRPIVMNTLVLAPFLAFGLKEDLHLVALFTAVFTGYNYGTMIPDVLETKFRETLKMDSHIQDILNNMDPQAKKYLSSVSRTFAIPTPLYYSLRKVGREEFDADDIKEIIRETDRVVRMPGEDGLRQREFLEATKDMNDREREDYVDQMYAAKQVEFPEGRFRTIEFDSFTYFDEEQNEPVWILYFRAHKQEPHQKKNPPKRKVDHLEKAKEWFKGLIPTPQPVALPIPVKR